MNGQGLILVLTEILFSHILNDLGVLCIEEKCLQWISSSDSEFRSHCYWLNDSSTEYVNAFEASRICEQNGGQLAPYIDGEQYDFLSSLVPQTGEKAWLGLNDLRHEGHFVNWNGEPTVAEVVHWRYDNPNGQRGQNCVEMMYSTTYVLQDRQCMEVTPHTPKAFLCMKEYRMQEQCHRWTNADGQEIKDCYSVLFSETPLGIFSAREKCHLEKDDLAPAITDDQMQLLWRLFNETLNPNFTDNKPFPESHSAWIGLNMMSTSYYENLDGSPTFVDTSQFEACSSSNCGCLLLECANECKVKMANCEEEYAYWAICSRREMCSAYRRSLICATDDRISSVSIGVVGISVLVTVVVLLAAADCSRFCTSERNNSRKL